MLNPGQEHWVGIKRIFRYIKGTLDYGIKFKASSDEFKFCGYADWAGDVTSGEGVQLGMSFSWEMIQSPGNQKDSCCSIVNRS